MADPAAHLTGPQSSVARSPDRLDRRPLARSDERHLAAESFLIEEAHLLDTARFADWLDLLHPDVVYRMPIRVTAAKAADEADLVTMDHFDEDLYSLRLRVARFQTDSAWTEDPPSRVRHHVSNVRAFAAAQVDGDVGAADVDGGDPAGAAAVPDAVVVESAVLVYRSRGDRTPPSVLSAGRTDTLVPGPNGLLLRRRLIEIDESVLRTQNLAIFL